MAKTVSTKPISKKRKFVKDGIFYAELNDFLARELAENGYAGCEVRVTPKRTEVTIRATQVLQVVGENGRRIRELTALVQKRFRFKKRGIFMYAEKIPNKGLSALAQAQAVKFRLLQGLSVRRAAYSVVQFIMNKEAKGCEVIVSGKLRGQRAKGMKFKDGYMIHAGDATNYYIDTAVKHVHLRQGVIGIKVKIMLPYDPNGVKGVNRPLPDEIIMHDIIDKGDDDDDDNNNDNNNNNNNNNNNMDNQDNNNNNNQGGGQQFGGGQDDGGQFGDGGMGNNDNNNNDNNNNNGQFGDGGMGDNNNNNNNNNQDNNDNNNNNNLNDNNNNNNNDQSGFNDQSGYGQQQNIQQQTGQQQFNDQSGGFGSNYQNTGYGYQ